MVRDWSGICIVHSSYIIIILLIKLFISSYLYQVIYIKLFISSYLYQVIYIKLFISCYSFHVTSTIHMLVVDMVVISYDLFIRFVHIICSYDLFIWFVYIIMMQYCIVVAWRGSRIILRVLACINIHWHYVIV